MTTSRRPLLIGAPLALIALLAVGSMGLTCGPAPPTTESCTPMVPDGGLSDASITSVEIGRVENGAFIPFVDGGVAPLAIGGQGSTMIVAHLRVRGTGIPACLPQRTQLEQLDGSVYTNEQSPLTTDPDGAGGWITGEMFLVYYGDAQVQVRLRAWVGNVTTSVVVWTDAVGTVDAGVDATPDAFAR